MRQTNTSICLAVSVPSNSLRYSVDSIECVKLRSFDIHDALNIDAGEKFALSMECTSMHRYMICSELKMAFIKSKTIARYFISDVVLWLHMEQRLAYKQHTFQSTTLTGSFLQLLTCASNDQHSKRGE